MKVTKEILERATIAAEVNSIKWNQDRLNSWNADYRKQCREQKRLRKMQWYSQETRTECLKRTASTKALCKANVQKYAAALSMQLYGKVI